MLWLILGATFWAVSLADYILVLRKYVKGFGKKKTAELPVLPAGKRKLLWVLVGLKAAVFAAQLVTGPLVDGFAIGVTLLMTLGIDLFGSSTGLGSQMALIWDYLLLKNAYEPKTEASGEDGRQEAAREAYGRRFRVLCVVFGVLGVGLGIAAYYTAGDVRRAVLIALMLLILVAVPAASLFLWLSTIGRAKRPAGQPAEDDRQEPEQNDERP